VLHFGVGFPYLLGEVSGRGLCPSTENFLTSEWKMADLSQLINNVISKVVYRLKFLPTFLAGVWKQSPWQGPVANKPKSL